MFRYYNLEFYRSLVFTEYVLNEVLKKRKFATIFCDNEQILIGEEAEEWIDKHDFMNEKTNRIILKPVNDRNGIKGYSIKHFGDMSNLLIPQDIIYEATSGKELENSWTHIAEPV